ncbi:MAG: hypothetical protein PHV34_24470 [Verrucomicrobiae bacterium]|nr:hypothetical protein [Verrucomicrobiae bacterium]
MKPPKKGHFQTGVYRGALLDFRPYAAHVDKVAGNDSPSLWDMNHPFIVQNRHCYTTIGKGMMKAGGRTIDLSEIKLEIGRVERNADGTLVRYVPKRIESGGFVFTLDSQLKIRPDGSFQTTRRILNPSERGRKIDFCEYLRGTWSAHDLSQGFAGLVLNAVSSGGQAQLLVCAHRGRVLRLDGAEACSVGFPKEQFLLEIRSPGGGCVATVREGTLFQTFYELSLEKTVKLDDEAEFSVDWRIRKIPIAVPETDSPLTVLGCDAPPRFKTEWGPSENPLRCPWCLGDERETHLLEENGLYRCVCCSFSGTLDDVKREYQILRSRYDVGRQNK